MKFTSKQDLSKLENFYKVVKTLDYRQVSYGFYDTPHYSGLNSATIAAIHQEGWNGLPARNFMTTSHIALQKDLKRLQKDMFVYMAAGGKDPTPILNMMGKAGVKKIKFIIDSGDFTNNKVSAKWAAEKGFSEAMYHYSALKNSASFKVSRGRKED